MRIVLLALALASCDQFEKDRPSGWDYNQQLAILEQESEIKALERNQADMKADIETLERLVDANIKVDQDNRKIREERWQAYLRHVHPTQN